MTNYLLFCLTFKDHLVADLDFTYISILVLMINNNSNMHILVWCKRSLTFHILRKVLLF